MKGIVHVDIVVMIMWNYKLPSIIFLILIIAFVSQCYADATIKYSITQANWTNLTTPYNFSVKAWLDNDESNPIIKETPYARFVVWVEPDSNASHVDEYLVHTNATTINGYASIYYKAELFNSSGEHPTTSGSNPTYAWGDSDGEHWYWGAILKSEFGDKEKQQANVKTSISLMAIILSIISMGYLLLWVGK